MKRFFLWSLAVVVVLAVAISLAFRFSPWPSVLVITLAFSRGDQASEAALEKHVPPGIVSRIDLAYGDGDDERFDINYPAGTSTPRPTIVWVHGGGWVAGSKQGVANYLKVLAGHGYTTVGVEYSTGFGARYPKPVRQVNMALDHLVRNAADLHIDREAIVLAGDSAGAQIAAQLGIITTDPAYARRIGIVPSLPPERLRALLLLSGAYDVSAIDFDDDHAWFTKTVLWAYSGTEDFREDEQFKLLSVTHYVTRAFPSSFISSGNGDPLAPQAVALANKLETLGVRVDTLFYPPDRSPALPHEYQFNLDDPAGQEALERTMAFVRSVSGHQAGASR